MLAQVSNMEGEGSVQVSKIMVPNPRAVLSLALMLCFVVQALQEAGGLGP